MREPRPDALGRARGLHLSPLATRLLALRSPPGAGPEWLEPDLDVILAHDPHSMVGMDAAVERLQRAARDRERVFVVTDYDADGTTSSLILQHALRLASGGATPLSWHIPDRFTEGYGFRPVAADRAHELGASLIVTADIGVRDHDAVTHARSLGLDVLVCDHHLPADADVPADANAVLCPPQRSCSYANPALAACGVSLKLAQAILAKHPKRDRILRSFLKLAAIGTVADVVDLSTAENRAIVALGMQALTEDRHSPGLTALLEVAEIKRGERLRTSHLGFKLGPRINAAGRMERATAVVELLNETDPERARARAADLDRVNRERKALQGRLETLAKAQVPDPPPAFVVVWGAEEPDGSSPWHRGIVGIVASRLRDAHHRPVAVVTTTGPFARGSIRSPPGFHAVRALDSASDLLDRYGGHAAAAGFSLPTKHLAALADRLQQWAEMAGVGTALPVLEADADARPEELSLRTLAELERLGPFGKGNPEPVVRLRGVRPGRVGTMGKAGTHLQFRLGATRSVWWRAADHQQALDNGRPIDLLVRLKRNQYRGRESLELEVIDARPSDE